MNQPKMDMWPVVLGIIVILLMSASHLPQGMSGSGVPMPSLSVKTVEQNSPGLNNGPQDTQPIIPPNDSEMVVKPAIPPNPDAVVTPPVLDSEMVVDPTTGEPMSEEKLERLTPEALEKNAPEEK
ncbi:hypothetical protein [Candidatus Nitrospira allomarina]|uniref:Uncharacterized protein n=1 Tax=Candidatus Nitrospira allomarina TaxID=3020900 RepID=A0AA96G767_9BACT|nr:hypothetical protein [Candidatus Nitrospira allomarina]WNM56634.1 hypothetical protein PP769_11665 [Candidatus Nitrospira allomarina]